MSLDKRVAVSSLAIIILSLLALTAATGALYSFGRHGSTQVNGDCLLQLPVDAVLRGDAHDKAGVALAGVNVTFANGTWKFFPEDACPQPAAAWAGTPSYGGFEMYRLAVTAEESPAFVAAKNGSAYLLDPLGSTGMSYASTTGTYSATLEFDHYSDKTISPCGYASAGQWHLRLGQITVTFYKHTDGSWDLSHPDVRLTPTGLLNTWLCPPAPLHP